MTNRFLTLPALIVIANGAAYAAPPASKDACLEQAFALAEKAAAKKLPADKMTKVEELIGAVEGKCAADDLAGAEGAIKAAQAAIDAP
jgi:hypothetical protein